MEFMLARFKENLKKMASPERDEFLFRQAVPNLRIQFGRDWPNVRAAVSAHATIGSKTAAAYS